MRCSGGMSRPVSTAIPLRLTLRTEQILSLAPRRNRSNLPPIPALSSRVAFRVSPICPTTPSTASADMKQVFGAKPARFFLLLNPWIATNSGVEGVVSVSAADKNSRSTSQNN